MKKEEARHLIEQNTDCDPDTGCWVWRRPKFTVVVNGKIRQPSNLAYAAYIGKREEYETIRHTCDNPLCVNPEHLYTESDMSEHLKHPRYDRADTHLAEQLLRTMQKRYGLPAKVTTPMLREIMKLNAERGNTDGETSI